MIWLWTMADLLSKLLCEFQGDKGADEIFGCKLDSKALSLNWGI